MDRIRALEEEISEIRKSLNIKEKQLYELKKEWKSATYTPSEDPLAAGEPQKPLNGNQRVDRLPKWAIERYSRQILLPDIGVRGQEKLCAAKVLVVGAGGLGCPAAMYLAGAGVGEIGIVDYDTVDLTNLHRQVLHGESDQNMDKVESAADTLRNINSRIKITPYNHQLESSNALEIACKYDIILDCSDNVPTRYLLNDVCVLAKVPLISGSALKMEGQITIYGYRANRNPDEKDQSYLGPCYRCVFPAPPPAEAVGSCSANGVAGPVPGVIGALQALEAIKYIVGHTHDKLLVGRMTLFDGDDLTFRNVRLRPHNPECAACSNTPTITRLIDYETFCKAKAKEKKRQEARLKSQRRREEKAKRMNGQSYLGFRLTAGKNKWVQDVPKSERKIGPPCACVRNQNTKYCRQFTQEIRQSIFNSFWNDLNWPEKKTHVRSLVDNVPPKRRRVCIKGDVSRKLDSKVYHLNLDENRLKVCRIMFLNTLGIKEATVRCWLVKEIVPKKGKPRLKAMNVENYFENLPKSPPKCQFCRQNSEIQYINLNNIKNAYNLYNLYVEDMKLSKITPASRKTFTKVFVSKNLRIFKAKNDTDVCDIVSQHNILPSINNYQNLEIVEEDGDNVTVNYYFNNEQW